MSTVENDAPRTELNTSRKAGAYRALLMRLHFYAGVFVGPFLLVAALTGGLYAIAPSLEQWMYRDYLHSDARGSFQPVSDQIRTAQQALPDLTVNAVRPATAPGDTTWVLFTDPAASSSSYRRAVFVDPVTSASLGELTVYGNCGALPVRTWLSNLHRSLLLGDPGRAYSELAASWLWVIALGGVALWIGRYRQMTRRGNRAARLLTVDRSASSGRTRTLNWHGATGIWIAVGLLFLSATGLTWSTYAGANVAALRSALSWTTPSVSTELTPAVVDGQSISAEPGSAATRSVQEASDVDGVLESARAAGLAGAVEVRIPETPDTAFTVTQTRQPWVMSNNTVAVDGATGEITDQSWFAQWPLAAKLSAWGIQLHMGTLFGLPNQLVLLALAGLLVTVVVRGYLMWWRRRPTRGGVGRPPRRGALAGLPPGAAVAVGITALLIGWFIPLLGLSLLGFLAVDVTIGAIRAKR